MRDCPNVASRGREAKQDPPRVAEGGAPKRNLLYALLAKGTKTDDDDAGKLQISLLCNDGFLLRVGVW